MVLSPRCCCTSRVIVSTPFWPGNMKRGCIDGGQTTVTQIDVHHYTDDLFDNALCSWSSWFYRDSKVFSSYSRGVIFASNSDLRWGMLVGEGLIQIDCETNRALFSPAVGRLSLDIIHHQGRIHAPIFRMRGKRDCPDTYSLGSSISALSKFKEVLGRNSGCLPA